MVATPPNAQTPLEPHTTLVAHHPVLRCSLNLKPLAVDEELHADRVHRVVRSEGNKLIAEFAAIDARMLRVSVNSFFEMAVLATRTLDEL
eukprot:2244254-Rhodomonas_salina.1